MLRLFNNHTPLSAARRLMALVRGVGAAQTFAIAASVIDDKCIRSFDRKYHVKTTGYILLSNTSVDPKRLQDATQYGPVNGWGFRRALRQLDLPRHMNFVDLGCGLGRACIVAAEYGFHRVTGVELAPEFCATARRNVTKCRLRSGQISAITILEMDALEYCDQTEDDIFFMFRPFSWEFLTRILGKLTIRAELLKRPLTVIYSERMFLSQSFAPGISQYRGFRKICEIGSFGQAFYVYQCG
jgi:hypothetical protein